MRKKLWAMWTIFAICTAVLFEPGPAAAGGGSALCERQMARAAREQSVPLGVLYAVALTETGNKGSLHPYALNIEGRTVFAKSVDDALAAFEAARASGARLIDLGCMQVNHHYHGRKFISVRAMLDPASNVSYAAGFLRRLRDSEGSWSMAVARYHAGPNNNPAQKRYICAVIRNLVASGFGAWTPDSRQFCN